jgi:hypothetical protein
MFLTVTTAVSLTATPLDEYLPVTDTTLSAVTLMALSTPAVLMLVAVEFSDQATEGVTSTVAPPSNIALAVQLALVRSFIVAGQVTSNPTSPPDTTSKSVCVVVCTSAGHVSLGAHVTGALLAKRVRSRHASVRIRPTARYLPGGKLTLSVPE